MKVIPLGTTGFIPTHGKETPSVLVLDNKTAVLLDAGSGLKRLAEEGFHSELTGLDRLHVVFSHYHLDHTSGFNWLFRLWPGDIEVWLPTRPMVDFEGKKALEVLTGPPLFPAPFETWPNCAGVHEVDRDEFQIGELSVRCIKQAHPGGSIGIRLGGFAYVTDTEPGDKHVQFLRDCDLVFMDTMFDSEDVASLPLDFLNLVKHGHSVLNAGLANAAGIKRLGLVHINPMYEESRIDNMLAEVKTVFPGAFIPDEGAVYEVG